MFNEMIVVSVTPFSGTSTADKNGENPVMLQCIAGRMPNRNVLSGTVARRAGIEVGKTYLMQVRESGFDKVFGPDFTFIKIMEIENAEDVAKTVKQIGQPHVFTVERPEGFEQVYQRKGDAVEGNRTKRIKEGQYIPALRTSTSHQTADEIIDGSSTENTSHLTEVDLAKGVNQSETDLSKKLG
jgi:hypothetical protein